MDDFEAIWNQLNYGIEIQSNGTPSLYLWLWLATQVLPTKLIFLYLICNYGSFKLSLINFSPIVITN